jgi:TonB family protein
MACHLVLGFFVLGILAKTLMKSPSVRTSPERLLIVQLSDLSISSPKKAHAPPTTRERSNRLEDVPLTSLPARNPDPTRVKTQDDIGVESAPVVVEGSDATAAQNVEENPQVSEIAPAEHTELPPIFGAPDNASPEYTHFMSEVRMLLERVKRYPWLARASHLEGTVTVGFFIDPTGAAHDIKVVTSSAHQILDDAAMMIVKNVDRFPQPPGKSGIQLIVPLDFTLSKP